MTEDELVATYPLLWHMAHDGAWPAIRDRGLRSSRSLVEDYVEDSARREALLAVRRPQNVPLELVGLPEAVLRDQKPMSDRALAGCLRDGLTPEEWYRILNGRTFFWLSRDRIWRLLKARAYRDTPQVVLTVDSRSLVSAHRERITLSPINSGSTIMKAQPRGHGTFMTVEQFPFAERAGKRPAKNNVVELTVDHSVPDVADHVLAVHRVRNDTIIERLWARDGVADNVGP